MEEAVRRDEDDISSMAPRAIVSTLTIPRLIWLATSASTKFGYVVLRRPARASAKPGRSVSSSQTISQRPCHGQRLRRARRRVKPGLVKHVAGRA